MTREQVEKRTIFLTMVGSHAYGTNTPTSDEDYRGVCIATKDYMLGFKKFDQFEGFPGEDKVIYDFRKILQLMADCNPNCIELLYTPERCIKVLTPYWQKVIDNRHLFLSKKAKHTFSGYAFSQLERISTHKKFLLEPLKKKPERTDFGLPERSIFPDTSSEAIVAIADDFFTKENKEEVIREIRNIYHSQFVDLFKKHVNPDYRTVAMEVLQQGATKYLNSIHSIGVDYIKEEYLDMARNELKYASAIGQWNRYKEWEKSRNKKRQEFEAKYGFDTKHAMHLVRLLRQGKEILETGQVNIDRTNIDAQELLAIRNGAWTYEQLMEYAGKMDKELGELYKTSTLQHSADVNKINELCIEITEYYLKDDEGSRWHNVMKFYQE